MDSFFIYRLPGENEFTGGIGTTKTGIDDDGFLISSFYNQKGSTLTILKHDNFTLESLKNYQENLQTLPLKGNERVSSFSFPQHSTPKEKYIDDVGEIISELSENEKTVYCRAICGDGVIDLAQTLTALDESFPEAMVFCFHTPHSGTWIGATPEKLLKRFNGTLSTMALAGTRIASGPHEWDIKNIQEQRMVTDYIENILNRYELSFSHDLMPVTKKVGKLEHLCTNFLAKGQKMKDRHQLLDFLYDLSPTPALCGFPKRKAFNIIGNKENFSRAFYGGFLGPLFSNGDFSLYVILRSLRIEGNHWCMYAGGGITSASLPEAEWEETEKKAASILGKLHFIK